jgi:UDP-N-acetylmuramoyl-L-alanyl-D-glutamate--2,6-diaminopimelate ligase
MSGRPLLDLLRRAGIEISNPQDFRATVIQEVTDDSRNVRPGSCFVAVRGAGSDGHEFLEAAAKAGALAMVVERDPPAPWNARCIRVADTRIVLAKLAAAFYGLDRQGRPIHPLVGVTGTNGKTTVAWLIRSIYHAAGRSAVMLGTVEYDLAGQRRPAGLTTPGAVELCRLLAEARDAGATHAVMEVSSHALDQGRCAGLAFDAAVFTNLTGDHLDYHRSMESYAAAKRRLFESLSADGVAVVNTEDSWTPQMVRGTRARVVGYGFSSETADVIARIQQLRADGSCWVITGPDFELNITNALVGRHNVLNAVAAAATAWALGFPPKVIREGIESVRGVPGRLQRVEPPGHLFTVLVDYAHTDDALRNVLDAVRGLTPGRLICVFGCGGDRDRGKRPRMAAVAAVKADVVFVTSDNPRTEQPMAIINDILPGFGPKPSCRIEVEPDRRSAIQMAIADARPGDTVLIAGKGHETYQIVGHDILPFDDAEEAQTCLGLRRAKGAAA